MTSKTVLHAKHLEAGAKMVDFFGWEMPINYGSQIEEHNFVRNSAGMFDVSHMTIVDIKGDDAEYNTQRLIAILKGEGTDAENATIALNAGTSLWVHENAKDWKDGYAQALKLLKSGKGFEQLELIQGFYKNNA